MTLEYFQNVPIKLWSLIDALKAYDVAYDLTIAELCTILKHDLTTLKSTRKGISTFERAELLIQEFSDLQSLKCLKKSESDIKEDQINQPHSKDNAAVNTHYVTNGPSTSINAAPINNQKNIFHTTTEIPKKRMRVSSKIDENSDSNVYIKSPSMRATESKDCTEELPPFDELTQSRHLPNQLTLIHGKNQYSINTPSRTINSPHKPKLTNSHAESLKEYVKFATSNLITVDRPSAIYYKEQKKNQRENYSLKKYGLLDDIYEILNNMEFIDFPLNLWKRAFSNNNEKGADILVNTMKYVLCNFHMQCQDDYPITNNHERSFFVENVVPGLLALAKTSKLVSFSWCEFELQSIKSISMFDHDLNLIKTPRRYMDALGKMRSTSDTEIVIVESSSGGQLEDISHSIGDTIKTIECATASLIFTASKYKQASVKTFKSMKIFSIHIIKNVMTLIETSMNDKHTWKRIELRSCTIPNNWSTKLHMIKYFELLTTLYDGIIECEAVEKRLADEHIVPHYNGASLEEYLELN